MTEEELEKVREELDQWLAERGVDLVLYSSGSTGDIILECKKTYRSLAIR